jgi:hypothetical protein
VTGIHSWEEKVTVKILTQPKTLLTNPALVYTKKKKPPKLKEMMLSCYSISTLTLALMF